MKVEAFSENCSLAGEDGQVGTIVKGSQAVSE